MGRTFLFAVLAMSFATVSARADLQPCGLTGSVSDRIQDCKNINGQDAIRAKDWVLVTKTQGEGAESWMESDSDLIWLQPEPGSFTWQEARAACAAKGLWLPNRYEFDRADDQGMRQVLPFLRRKLWWTYTESDFEGAAFFYNGTRGYTDDGNQTEKHRVVCAMKVSQQDRK